MRYFKYYLIGFFVLLGLLFLYHSLQSSWSQVTQKDLTAVYETLKNNHPGFYDVHNPDFNRWLEQGYELALGKADKVSSFADYVFLLRLYINGFQDYHVSLMFDSAKLPSEWPGFIVEYCDGSFFVLRSQIAKIPTGAELILVDDLSPKEWMEKYSFPYLGNQTLEASWALNAYRLSFWEGSSFAPKPQRYSFKIGLKSLTVSPRWSSISLQELKEIETPKHSKHTYGIDEFEPQKIWVSLPSFFPQTKEEEDVLKQIADKIINFREYKLIVFDMQYNHGGNSAWGSMILKELYGQELYNCYQKERRDNVYVEWRASKDNISHLEAWFLKIQKQFGSSDVVKSYQLLIEGMKNAFNSGNHLYSTYKKEDSRDSQPCIALPNPVKAKVVVLTDYHCVSSCLTFMDELLSMPNVLHVGYPTSADSNYTDVRFITLPSSLASLKVPMKVFRNRSRKSNECYMPQIRQPSCMRDTNALKSWIGELG